MKKMTSLLGLDDGSIVAVVGCGGKTSLIRLLADENSHRNVLISPTTRMRPMQGTVGVYQEATGKLLSLPPETLAAIVGAYDLSLLEADGSAGLPCKGWRQDEPVVPPYSTHTVGVVTLGAIGRPATSDVCLRLPLFLALTELHEGDPVTPEALLRMVCAPEGMFRAHAGACSLFVNQVEDPETTEVARRWLRDVRAHRPGFFSTLLYGSLHRREWRELEER